MLHPSLSSIEAAIRRAWSVQTCDPVDQPKWSKANPACGQCASTALVLQGLLGGELLIADVHNADGSRNGVHYWNRLAGGDQLDLTREQFRAGESIGAARPAAIPADLNRGRLAGHHHLLSARVARELDGTAGDDPGRPVTIKGICVDQGDRLLVCHNHRGEWELPGGRPETGEPFGDCLAREMREEAGVGVVVDRVVGVTELEVLPGRWVDVVGYVCTLADDPRLSAIKHSDEHTAIEFRDPSTLTQNEFPAAYRHLADQR